MLQVAEETAKKIETASQLYRPCSVRASVLYFVLNDLSGVDPMYQFSLDAYNDLFLLSIRNSPKSENLQERIKSLNEYHTYGVYKVRAGRKGEGKPCIEFGFRLVMLLGQWQMQRDKQVDRLLLKHSCTSYPPPS